MSNEVVTPTEIETPAADPVATPAEPAAADTSWVPKRIGEITAARRAAEQRAEQAERELANLRANLQQQSDPAPPNNQSVEQLARAYAERMVRDQTEQHSLNAKAAAIEQAGVKEFGQDFNTAIQNLQAAGIGGPEFLKVITNVPAPEKLITWLGKGENLNEAMRVASLDPVEMAVEMTKLSSKAVQAFSKPVSKAPAPIQPLEGGSSGGGGEEPNAQTDPKGWIEWRKKTARRR